METNLAGGDNLRLYGRAALGRRISFICEFVDELIDRTAGRHLDAGLRRSGDPSQVQQGGGHQGRTQRREERLGAGAGYLGGSAYFVPLAKWIVSKTSGWQVWSVERRENLLEDQSELNLYKQHKATTTQLFDYYLGYLKNPSITHHFQPVPNSSVEFAKQWGMNVAVQDLHMVVGAAKKLGGKVVLGGHSLGGSVVTAYATWDFNGRAGADELAGLVYIDGGSTPTPVSAAGSDPDAAGTRSPDATPWLSFGGISAPYAGLFRPQDRRLPCWTRTRLRWVRPRDSCPPTSSRRSASPMWASTATRSTPPPHRQACWRPRPTWARASPQGPVHGWDGSGALTPIKRFATMFSGAAIQNADGTEWYFPQRLTDDTGAVANGNANPAQSVLDVDATMGHHLPKNLLI